MGSSKSVTIGNRYFMGMHLVICHGPVDAVREIIVGERSAWTGNVTANTTIQVDSPDLFGGEDKEGGVEGPVDIAFGEENQAKNTYLIQQLGSNVPAFRGVLSLVLNQCYVTAMSRYPKPWAIKVERAPARSWYDATAEIAGNGIPTDPDFIPSGSANPAHILYETLTDSDWGLGLSSANLDDTAFRAAADTLFAENFGLSLQFTRQSPVAEFIQTVLTHISGLLYTDRVTGNFVLTLIRQPTQTELDNAKVFNETNIVELSDYERPSFAEMINEVVLGYRPQGTLKDSSITVQDLAAVQAEGGVVSQTVQFPGIDNSTIAGRVALREIRQYSTPLAKIRFSTNRDAWDISIGDIIKFNWTDYGIQNMILRVFNIDYGSLANGEIILDTTEDIFSLPQTTYLMNQPSDWVDPVQDPVAITTVALTEIPYYEIATNFSSGDIASFDQFTAFLQVLAVTPASATPNYQLWLSPDTTISNYVFDISGAYTPSVLLNQNLTVPNSNDAQVVSVASFVGAFIGFEVDTYGYIGNEVVLVEAVNLSANTITIRRGILDSLPQAHNIGTRVYFAEGNDTQSAAQYVGDPTDGVGDTVYARLLTQTDIGVLPIASAPENNFVFFGRQTRPFQPVALTIETAFYPIARQQLVGGTTEIAWRSRNRTLQITKPFNTFYVTTGSNPPEDNTKFIIRYYGETNNFLREVEVAGTTASSYSTEYTFDDEASDSGLITFGNLTVLTQVSATLTGPLTVEFLTTNTERRARPDKAAIYADKIYAEFNASDNSFYVGISNENTLYDRNNPTNVAYLNALNDTLTGQITGTVGSGTLDSGWAAIAIDTNNQKFWIRNTDGTWRDGDPATNTGGFSYSTLTYDFVYFAIANNTSGLTTTVEFNFGATAFTHTIPSGFVNYQPDEITDVTLDDSDIGAGLTLSADKLTVFAVSAPSWARFKSTLPKAGGRWYFEMVPLRIDDIGSLAIGVMSSTSSVTGALGDTGQVAWTANGTLRVNNGNQPAISTYAVNDKIGVAFDTRTGEVWLYKNGVLESGPHTITIQTDIVPAGAILTDRGDIRFSPAVVPPTGFAVFNLGQGSDTSRLNNSLRVEAYTVRTDTIDSTPTDIESWQRFDHTFDRSGYGYSYGQYYGGVNS